MARAKPEARREFEPWPGFELTILPDQTITPIQLRVTSDDHHQISFALNRIHLKRLKSAIERVEEVLNGHRQL
jgi:hypothetical protein